MIRKELLADAGTAAGVLAVSLAILGAGGSEGDARSLDALGVALAALAALAALPLLARRRAPLAVFALTAAASAALAGLHYPPGPPLGPTVALFFVGLDPAATRARPRLTAATVASFFALHVTAAGLAQDEFPLVPLLAGALVWGGAWVIGDRIRQRHERMAELEERALRAERETERERRLAAAEERTRIARDLHDSAGHAINVILVQAGAARLLQEQDPTRTRAALETIEEVARETLGEIDQLVRALREDGKADDGEVEPPPGLAALDTLVERHHASGLAITVRVDGARRQLAPGIDRAAYRIIQEALTNSARHGDGSADVELAFGRQALELAVTNPTSRGAAPTDGHGIVGMRERTALLGGDFETSLDHGVFRVRAHLPYSGGERQRP
ncbi:MAG: histidine kinase [Gaiellaceae bacterium MAG52_C11]|nr:histidine kinase [Candidatus Gaiellasilicea maunaloa]